jgi:hypothetical protein
VTDCEITCITKPNVHSAHEHITHVGNPSWSVKRLTVENVIARLKSRTDAFYVQDPRGTRAYVKVVPASAGRREYIRTYVDNTPTDNLLSLNQCSL